MCPLYTLPKTFGLNVQDKGFVSHLFTTHGNLDVQLRNISEQHFYQPEFMKAAEKKKFEEWHAQQQAIYQQLNGSTEAMMKVNEEYGGGLDLFDGASEVRIIAVWPLDRNNGIIFTINNL